MAVLCFQDAFFSCGTTAAPVNLTDHVRAVTINYAAEMLDKTAMGSSFRKRLAGLKDWSVTVEFNQDYVAANVDATLFAYVGSTAKRINIRPTTAVVGANNPRFYGEALLESYPPIGGSVGDLATVTATFQGDGVMTRAISS
jgi:hypothetical protein